MMICLFEGKLKHGLMKKREYHQCLKLDCQKEYSFEILCNHSIFKPLKKLISILQINRRFDELMRKAFEKWLSFTTNCS